MVGTMTQALFYFKKISFSLAVQKKGHKHALSVLQDIGY